MACQTMLAGMKICIAGTQYSHDWRDWEVQFLNLHHSLTSSVMVFILSHKGTMEFSIHQAQTPTLSFIYFLCPTDYRLCLTWIALIMAHKEATPAGVVIKASPFFVSKFSTSFPWTISPNTTRSWGHVWSVRKECLVSKLMDNIEGTPPTISLNRGSTWSG